MRENNSHHYICTIECLTLLYASMKNMIVVCSFLWIANYILLHHVTIRCTSVTGNDPEVNLSGFCGNILLLYYTEYLTVLIEYFNFVTLQKASEDSLD